MLDVIQERGQSAILTVQVVPRASRNEIAGIHGDALRIRLRAPPVEGAANAALIAFLAETLGVRRRQVEILSGHTSRRKSVLVSGLGKQQVAQRLESALAGAPETGTRQSAHYQRERPRRTHHE